MSTTHNTLQNYLEKYIKQTLGNKVPNNKLYKELLNKVKEIIKQTVNKARHQDDRLDEVYYDKKLLNAMAKQHIYQVSKIDLDGVDINGNGSKLLEGREDIVNTINNIDLMQPGKESEPLNIKKSLAHSIPPQSNSLQYATAEKYISQNMLEKH